MSRFFPFSFFSSGRFGLEKRKLTCFLCLPANIAFLAAFYVTKADLLASEVAERSLVAVPDSCSKTDHLYPIQPFHFSEPPKELDLEQYCGVMATC